MDCYKLQNKINEEESDYDIIDLSVAGVPLYKRYKKIFDRKMGVRDIVIVRTNSWIDIDENTILIDWDKIGSFMQGQQWYWDIPAHCNYQVYEIVANQIYEKINKQLIQKTIKNTFYLNNNLEREIQKYLNRIQIKLETLENYKNYSSHFEMDFFTAGAIVMNCNPFTYGHQYLIDTAARLVNILYIFVVQEDKSIFSFEQRFKMVEDGTKHLNNVIVIPSGKFMISSITFPGYFLKEKPKTDSYDSFLDLKIFAHYIAHRFRIRIRFVGEEPFDKVTAQYIQDMKKILKDEGIEVLEIPRKKLGSGEVISATTVRNLLEKQEWKKMEMFIPETTINILKKAAINNKASDCEFIRQEGTESCGEQV